LIALQLELQMKNPRNLLSSLLMLGTLAACSKPAASPAASTSTSTAEQRGLAPDGWIDVSATLQPGRTPVYEGDAPMVFTFLKDMNKGDALTLSKYDMGAHSGTHIDAPMHFIRDGASIDQVELTSLVGPARVIDIPDSVQAITAAELNRHNWKGGARLLFRTRSSLRGWMDSAQFHRDFAYIAADAAELIAQAGIALVGVDYISAEQFGAPAPRAHQILLGKGIPIVEGLDLRSAPAADYDLIVLPIKVAGHEGAPARAIVRPTISMSLPQVRVQQPVRQLGGAP
jgi:arylformamidase